MIEKVVARLMRLGPLGGWDQQVTSTFLLRGWSIVAGVVMVLFIPTWLGKVEQGYYYTFASLLALQIFFELGMSQVVVLQVSRNAAQVTISDAGVLGGDTNRLNYLAALVRLLRRWYAAGGVLFFFLVGTAGLLFFSTHGHLPMAEWCGAWLLVTLGTAINLALSVNLAVLEGYGDVASVARMRVSQSIIGSAVMWVAFSLGASLWSVSIVPLVGAAYTYYWLSEHGILIRLLHKHAKVRGVLTIINWRTDIFPLQWRIAVSWISGYFIFQLFTPLAFANLGPIEAGRLGISMTVFGALLNIGMSWVSAKVPAMSAFVALNERDKLNELFKTMLKHSMLFTCAASLMILLIVFAMTWLQIDLALRFVSLRVAGILALIAIINCFIFSAAAYMRAHNEEPMMLPSVISGVATLMAVVIGSRLSVDFMMMLYLLIGIFIGLPWTTLLFFKYYKRVV